MRIIIMISLDLYPGPIRDYLLIQFCCAINNSAEIKPMAKNTIGRKNFLKSAVTGLAGVSFLGSTIAPKLQTDEDATEGRKFIYRTLGNTGIKVPIVSMGVMNAQNPALVKAALDAGINFLDTAHGYQRGRNEEMIGGVIKNRPRDSFIIATKIPPSIEDSDKKAVDLFRSKFDLSLKRLKLDYVDILYLHSAKSRETASNPIFMDVMAALKDEGKVRHLGVSTHSNEPEVIRAATESKHIEVVLTSINYKQDHRDEIKKAIAEAAAAGMGIVAMKTMAGAWLDEAKTIPVNTTAALKWVLQDPNIHVAIPGFVTFDQMESSLSVMADLALNRVEQKDLEQQSALPGLYCQGCDVCLPNCRQSLPIDRIMRAYMYTYGYSNLGAAQDLLTALDLPKDICGDCTDCAIKCVKGFDVASRVKNVSRLRDVPEEFLA